MKLCKALGNIQVPKNDKGLVDGAAAQNQFRNQAVGLGGNVALVTEGFVSIPVAGVSPTTVRERVARRSVALSANWRHPQSNTTFP